MIRLAREADLPILQDIEIAAGKAFVDVDMAPIAEDEPPSAEFLRRHLRAGRAWVYVNEDEFPVAYLIADLVDGSVHIEQVSVHPAYARRGIGRALLERVAIWAKEQGAAALTLTTFTEVAWNGPYYERCGFRRLSEEELTPGLREIRKAEAERGLDRWPRACMRREL